MQGKCPRGMQVLAGLILLALWPALAGCSSTGSKPVEDLSQAPPSQGATEPRTTKPYVFDVGDEVTIQVWGYDDLKKTVVINPSGDIYYPMLGRLQLAGKTVPQAQELLTARIKKYLIDPQVDITSTTGRRQIYVAGEVNNPTVVSYTRPLLVTEALAKASWFTQYANKSKVLVVRRTDNKYNVYTINTGRDGSQAPPVYLQEGDIVFVPPTLIVDIGRYMSNFQSIMQPFLTAEQMVVLWPAFTNALTGKTSTSLAISTTTSGSK